MSNVVPIRPGIDLSKMTVNPAGQVVLAGTSPWTIIGWVAVGLIAWEGGKYLIRKAEQAPAYSRSRRSRR